VKLLLLIAAVVCFILTAFDWLKNDTVVWLYLGLAFWAAAFAVGEDLPARKRSSNQ
jgi:hypothetical protein